MVGAEDSCWIIQPSDDDFLHVPIRATSAVVMTKRHPPLVSETLVIPDHEVSRTMVIRRRKGISRISFFLVPMKDNVAMISSQN